MSDKRRKWKEFYVQSIDDQRALASAWQSSHEPSAPYTFEVIKGTGFVRTNLPLRQCRALFRHAGVRWYDYVHAIEEPIE